MSTAICPYCEPDTAGRHAASCPSRWVAAKANGEKCYLVLAESRPNPKAWHIFQARLTMWEALQNDPGLKDGYVSNIAMLIHDRLGGVEVGPRNELASEILDLLFKPDAPGESR